MKLFQLVQKYYHSVGIYPTELNPNGPFNLRNFRFLLMTGAFFASTISSFIFQSTTIIDYAESFNIFSTTFASMVSFWATIRNAERIFTFINDLENYIQISKFDRIETTNRKVFQLKSFVIFTIRIAKYVN